MTRHHLFSMEALEGRQLLSGISPSPVIDPAVFAHPAVAVASPGAGVGNALDLVADQAFAGAVGFFPSSPINATLMPSVSIDWGDGSVTSGTIQAAVQNDVAGYDVIGSHTYTAPGTYSTSSSVTAGPATAPGGGATPLFIVFLAQILGSATVAPANSAPTPAGGMELNVAVGQSLSGAVAFYGSAPIDPTLTPSTTIDWGDGVVTSGAVQATVQNGVSGYEVIGAHTYAATGTFTVAASFAVTPTAEAGSTTPTVLAQIVSTAAVTNVGSAAPIITVFQETAGDRFTAAIGSVNAVAPKTHLRVTIDWGDGKRSVKTLTTAASGGSSLTFNVSGAHRYAHAGTYSIQTEVVQLPAHASGGKQVVATFDNTATVQAAVTSKKSS